MGGRVRWLDGWMDEWGGWSEWVGWMGELSELGG